MMNSNLIQNLYMATTTSVHIDRPYLFFLLIPAVILAIIPFFRLNKKRRFALKHIVPLIVHLLIIALLTTLVTGIKFVKTTSYTQGTQIMVVADVSDSNRDMQTEMNAYINSLYANADENTEIGVMLFSSDQVVYATKMGDTSSDHFKSVSDLESSNETDIQNALNAAMEELEKSDASYDKKIILLSDGRQTMGNAWSAAKLLKSNDITLYGKCFDVTKSGYMSEVQLLSLEAKVKPDSVDEVSVSVTLKSTTDTIATIDFYELEQGSMDISSSRLIGSIDAQLKKGNNAYPFSYRADGAGIHSLYAKVRTSDDTIDENNTLYSWFSIDSIARILIVDGDGTQSLKVVPLLSDYDVTVINSASFPSSMEELLKYDEVILMNPNFDEMPNDASDLITRYVSEVGRGLVFTTGDHIYDTANETFATNPILELLPVDMKVEKVEDTLATVLVLDLSSSMGQGMSIINPNTNKTMTRYDMLLEGVKNVINSDKFSSQDHIGMVLFDANAYIAMELTKLEEKEWIIEHVEYELEKYFYNHTDESNPSYSNRVMGGRQDVNGYSMKTYGTNYKFAIQYASEMLTDSDANLKQMVFISDGAPSDKGSGYASIVKSMANSGVVTSTIAIALDKDSASMTEELYSLAEYGKGKFTQVKTLEDLTSSLFELAEMKRGEKLNEGRDDIVLEKRQNSNIFIGVDSTLQFDKITGYYGTTLKRSAQMAISADDLRPIVAEWQRGIGYVTVFTSDLGRHLWTSSLFDDDDGIVNSTLVKNILTNSINKKGTNFSGLTVTNERVDNLTRVTVETPKRIRNNEKLIAYVTDPSGRVSTYDGFYRIADTKYRCEIDTNDFAGTYMIKVELVTDDDSPKVYDRNNYAIVGFYGKEYDLFSIDGEKTLSDICVAGNGELMNEEKFFSDSNKTIQLSQETKDITTPLIIAVIVLFLMDIFFRNFLKVRKEKKHEMTDEEQYASMRGR